MSTPDPRDGWAPGASFLAPATQGALRAALEETVLIVEHRHYRGGRAPTRLFVEEWDELAAYLARETRPGDHVWVWRYDQLCRDDNALAVGKLPDAAGRVPAGGAY